MCIANWYKYAKNHKCVEDRNQLVFQRVRYNAVNNQLWIKCIMRQYLKWNLKLLSRNCFHHFSSCLIGQREFPRNSRLSDKANCFKSSHEKNFPSQVCFRNCKSNDLLHFFKITKIIINISTLSIYFSYYRNFSIVKQKSTLWKWNEHKID